MSQQFDPSSKFPARLAIDANGYVWRVYSDDHWSMAPVNPDNNPIPEPVTYYEPIDFDPTPICTCGHRVPDHDGYGRCCATLECACQIGDEE